MENKLKVLDVLPIENNKSMIVLKETNSIRGFHYMKASTGEKYKIIGLATQSVEAHRKQIIDVMVDGMFSSSEASLSN